jgi:hypothetical protein
MNTRFSEALSLPAKSGFREFLFRAKKRSE